MVPCTLRRENCLVGDLLGKRLALNLEASTSSSSSIFANPANQINSGACAAGSMPSTPVEPESDNPFWTRNQGMIGTGAVEEGAGVTNNAEKDSQAGRMSRFERIVLSHPTVIDSLFAQLPTTSIINLFHTSTSIRDTLMTYPLAWKSLSFRLPQPALMLGSSGETPDSRDRSHKQYALDGMLFDIIVPLATRLTNLDLCNTAISGTELVALVLTPQAQTLQHLSVRGCKNVSIKYHIVPWLHMHLPRGIRTKQNQRRLALKSLYVYRCRHHRRRPYLPSSLIRRDSDSEPTHDLIELCHSLGIWTDTAWCPTPGGRCFRRKDYHNNRAAPGTFEVWVPFDRLWRSGNRIGPVDEIASKRRSDGRLWEDAETGFDGEALGASDSIACLGEGKDVPAHLRNSHRTFVEDVRCGDCGDPIQERCETCSIKMHCMGCRKTLCASCAFDKPVSRKRQKIRSFSSMMQSQANVGGFGNASDTSTPSTPVHGRATPSKRSPRFWWAPGASRSPNLLTEDHTLDSDTESGDEGTANATINISANSGAPPKLDMYWCCLEPIFSGGGGVAFIGPSLTGCGQDRIRAVPLPKSAEYEDPDFTTLTSTPSLPFQNSRNLQLYESMMNNGPDIYPYLQQSSIDVQAKTCPRSICKDCFHSFRWKVPCRSCKKPLCKEHDFRALKVRKCGYRDLAVERDHVLSPPREEANRMLEDMEIPAFGARSRKGRSGSSSRSGTPGFQPVESLNSLPPFGFVPLSQHASNSSRLAAMENRPATPAPDFFASSSRQSGNAFADNGNQPNLSTSAPSRRLHRSHSLSGLRGPPDVRLLSNQAGHVVATPTAAESKLPLPGYGSHPVQWQGCGAFFCPDTRPVGDTRLRCLSANPLRKCGECQVLVCEFCVPATTPTCPCSVCRATFHCPLCLTKPAIRAQCQRDAELKAADIKRLNDLKREIDDARRALSGQQSIHSSNAPFGSATLDNRPLPIPPAGSAVSIAEMRVESQTLSLVQGVLHDAAELGIMGAIMPSSSHRETEPEDQLPAPHDDVDEPTDADIQSGIDAPPSGHGDDDTDVEPEPLRSSLATSIGGGTHTFVHPPPVIPICRMPKLHSSNLSEASSSRSASSVMQSLTLEEASSSGKGKGKVASEVEDADQRIEAESEIAHSVDGPAIEAEVEVDAMV